MKNDALRFAAILSIVAGSVAISWIALSAWPLLGLLAAAWLTQPDQD